MCPTLTVVAPVSQGSPTLSCSVNQTSATQTYGGQSESFVFTASGSHGTYMFSAPDGTHSSSNGSYTYSTSNSGPSPVSVTSSDGGSKSCGTVTVNAPAANTPGVTVSTQSYQAQAQALAQKYGGTLITLPNGAGPQVTRSTSTAPSSTPRSLARGATFRTTSSRGRRRRE